ncbi:MAG TPA: hypothetical protein VIG03_05565 [Steroidobacteraceae bacterium]|jgi:hypothetical protein
MTSFAAAIEPAASPRLAAVALLAHTLAAAAPWLARVDVPLALLLTLAAIAGFALSLRRLPGRHCALAAIDLDAKGGCRARLSRSPQWLRAELGPGSRAYESLAVVDIRVGHRRYGWVLPRAALAPNEFRRLKARIRFS